MEAEELALVSMWQTEGCSGAPRRYHLSRQSRQARDWGKNTKTKKPQQIVLIPHERKILKIKIYNMKTSKSKKMAAMAWKMTILEQL